MAWENSQEPKRGKPTKRLFCILDLVQPEYTTSSPAESDTMEEMVEAETDSHGGKTRLADGLTSGFGGV